MFSPVLPFTLRTTILLFCLMFSTFVRNALTEQVMLKYDDLNLVFSEQHPFWPPFRIPPPSNITGLNGDFCYGTGDCVAPRACENCPSPPCQCTFKEGFCSSSSDCDPGEHCRWAPNAGLTVGECTSTRSHGDIPVPLLEDPDDSPLPLLGLGLTGDRCFSTSDCRGERICVGDTSLFGNLRLQNVSVCELSLYPCICTPVKFVECSAISDCASSKEFCASLVFETQDTYSYHTANESQTMRLTPLCMSLTLRDHENIVPISSRSSMDNISELPTASIRHPVSLKPTMLQSFLDESPDIPPFSVRSMPVFNSFSTNELANDFIGGILPLIIVAHLHRIIQGLIYFSPGIHHRGYSSYIIFSRLASMRNILRLFKRRKPFSNGTRHDKHELLKGYSFKVILFPLLALAVLYVAELITIIAGMQVRSEFFAERNFDTRIGEVGRRQLPRRVDGLKSDCDDFFVPTRGLFESGQVLKCVSVIGHYLWDFKAAITLRVEIFSGRTNFEITSSNGSSMTVDLSTFIRSKSGVNMRTMPFRPDLQSEQERNYFLNSILNAVRRRLGYSEVNASHAHWAGWELLGSRGIADSIIFRHYHGWNDSVEMIATSLMAELRDMDLVLNSTGKPWVFTRPYTIEQMNPSMAVVKQYRIANGWLVIAVVLVTAIHCVVNYRATHFDEVAFVAMKELMGEDCVLGPLVTDGAVGMEVDILEGDDMHEQEAVDPVR